MSSIARSRRRALDPKLEEVYDQALSVLWDECDACLAVKALTNTRVLRVMYTPNGRVAVERQPVNKRGWFPAPELLVDWAGVDRKGFSSAALKAGVALVW